MATPPTTGSPTPGARPTAATAPPKAAPPAATKAPPKRGAPPAKKAPAKKAAPPRTKAQRQAAQKTAAANAAKTADYGYAAAFLKAHPDVAKKVAQAVKEGWTPSRLQAEIKTTPWWQKRTEAQRQSDVLRTENPAEWQRQINQKIADIHTEASNLGISLSDDDIAKMADQFLTNGSSQGEMQTAIAMKFSMGSGEVTGQAGQNLDALTKTASDFGVTLDPATAQKMVQDSLANGKTAADYADHFREQAKVLYPGISDWLDKNPTMTSRDYASPYLQIASNMLGQPVDQMDISDPKWSRLFSGNNGQPLSADQWNSTIKTDGQYGWDKTFGAQQDAYQMVDSLRKTFQGA